MPKYIISINYQEEITAEDIENATEQFFINTVNTEQQTAESFIAEHISVDQITE